MNDLLKKTRLSLAYKTYINSREWKLKSKNFVKLIGKCEECGTKNKLQSHHKHYRTFGCESISDIRILCNRCHYNITRKRYWVKKKLGFIGIPFNYNHRDKYFWEETYKDRIYKLLTNKNYDTLK